MGIFVMSAKQACIRFEHPCGGKTSSQWRQELLKFLPEALQDVVVFQSATALSFTAKTPQASDRLKDDPLALMRGVSAAAGKTLSVDMLELSPQAARTGYRWQYQVPRLVVARSGDDWAPWREALLTSAQTAKIGERITADLRQQMEMWGIADGDLGLEMVSAGSPMVLKDAVANGPKPTSAMARKGVVFSSKLRIEGAFWVGLLQATGHGRVYREGYEAQE